MKKIGVDAISFYVPSIYLSIEELSKNRNLNFEKLNKGLYGNSQFYRSVLDFHLMNTCNTWTANGLKSIGLEISPKNKITADSVMNYIKQAKNGLETKYRINCKNGKN